MERVGFRALRGQDWEQGSSMKTLDAVMGEKEFMASVVELATVLGWAQLPHSRQQALGPRFPRLCLRARRATHLR